VLRQQQQAGFAAAEEVPEMRRPLQTATVISTLALALPGAALASGHSTHHRRHDHRRSHSHQIEHVRTVHFGTVPTDVAPGQPPTAPPPSTSTAPKVVSFTAGKLTIELADGTIVSATVNDATEIRCEGIDQDPGMPGDQDRDDGDGSGAPGPSGPSGGSSQGGPGPSGDQDGGEDDQNRGDQDQDRGDVNDQNEDNDEDAERCTTAALQPGAVVGEAELRISAAGAVWEEIELVA
jgi:hypothetical protein